jgi:hypothetical protein
MDILTNIHSNIPHIEGGYMLDELPEQLLTCKYLKHFYKPGDTILELGCNIGRNTLVISSIIGQENCKDLTCMDSCEYSANVCKRNLNRYGFDDVLVLNNAISNIPLIQNKWQTYPLSNPLPSKHFIKVNTISWDIINTTYGPFTFLFCDCEGALYGILKENDTFLNNIKYIFIENDFDTLYEQGYVETIFKEKGFIRVYSEPLCREKEHRIHFYSVWERCF